jgi:two-component system NtrC family sensor kinase
MVMSENDLKGSSFRSLKRQPEDFSSYSRQILRAANRGILRADFLAEVCKTLVEFSGCDEIEIRLKERNRHYRATGIAGEEMEFRLDVIPGAKNEPSPIFPGQEADSDLEKLSRDILSGNIEPSASHFTHHGDFWTGDTGQSLTVGIRADGQNQEGQYLIKGAFKSLAILPFFIEVENTGLLFLKSRHRDYFMPDDIYLFAGVAQNLGVALVHRHVQIALRERVKELTCLYGIAKIVGLPDVSLAEILQSITELLPPAWLYPEIACARIIVDGQTYLSSVFAEGGKGLTTVIRVGQVERGSVEVIYKEAKPPLDEGPFLKEERNLIDTVAHEISLVLERRQAEEDKSRLQEQLRHADRLATIGQLAAGVAHELNEPLGNVLGFAQLAGKCPGLPESANQDLQKIISASLHAREVIKKLMVFARQMPPRKTEVNLNQVVEEGIYFLESRCVKGGIELEKDFSPDLPEIIADPSQLHQVLVNLLVNAIQAMPEGGKLTIRTRAANGNVVLIVQDTGIGMSPEIQKKIFIPFFTTKDVHEGTGLGLSVVHGIVTAHGGSIQVESRVGVGSKFEIQLPVIGPNGFKENGQNGRSD